MVALRSVTLPSMPSLPHLNISRTASQGGVLSPKLTDGPVSASGASEPGSAAGAESVAQGLLRRSISSRGVARASEPGQPRRSASVAPSPVVDDSAIAPDTGGYVSKLALQLGERVNRVFPASAAHAGKDAVAWKGRLAPRADRGEELARFLMSELQACRHDPYLLRSVLRSAVTKSLSVLLSRLDGLVVAPEPAGAEAFNAAIVRTTVAVRKGLTWPKNEAEPTAIRQALTPFRDRFDATVQRIVGPLLASLKAGISTAIARVEAAREQPTVPVVPTLSQAGALRGALSLARTSGVPTPPSAVGPIASALEAARKAIDTLGCDDGRWTVAIAMHAVWKGMLAIAARDVRAPAVKVPPSPSRLVRSASPPLAAADDAAVTDSIALLTIVRRFTALVDAPAHLPRATALAQGQPAAADVATCATACRLCAGAVLPEDVSDDEDDDAADATELAREALQEATLALESTTVLLRACGARNGPVALRAALTGPGSAESCSTLDRALETVPPLVLYHVLAAHARAHDPDARRLVLPHERWGSTWAEYERSLVGFRAAEEFAPEVASALLAETARIGGDSEWLALLALAVAQD